MRRIGFFGGSFDPPHAGHLDIAKAAADRFALDEVLFAPVGNQPLKEGRPAASFFHRYAMTALATEADSRFTPSLIDAPTLDSASPARPNYTVETLVRLRASFESQIELFTLVGADSWLDIPRWHEPARLLASSDWIVARRPGFSLADADRALPSGVTAEHLSGSADRGLLLHHPGDLTTNVYFLTDVNVDISATDMRASIAAGDAHPKGTIASVQEYVRKTRLYRQKK
jgi:nicotinate-nucleotide adenylyltransferase